MKKKQTPLVYILVLNYCSLDDTLACVSAIRQIDYPRLKVLVIDNDSPDGSGAELAQMISGEEMMRLDRNMGYAGGNDAGLRIALQQGADYVLVVNPDVRLPVDSVSKYVGIMQDDPSISALNPIQFTADGTTMDQFFRREMFDHNGYKTPSLPVSPDQLWDVKSLFGATLFLSRHTIEKVGGFDPLYFAYWEEIDLCRRIKYHGGRLVVTSAAPVVHLRSYKTRGHDAFRAYLRLKGEHLYKLKDTSKPYFSLLRATLIDLVRNIHTPASNEFGWGRREYLKTLHWVALNFVRIRKHRRIDIEGGSYL
jgi:hypothetical protein